MINKNNIMNISITALLLIGITGVGSLVFNEFTNHNVCPKLAGIPACYIIMVCFILALVSQLFKLNAKLFFLSAGIPFVIAMIGSGMQFLEKVECPKTDFGMPMCYISFLLFAAIISLKIITLKTSNKQT